MSSRAILWVATVVATAVMVTVSASASGPGGDTYSLSFSPNKPKLSSGFSFTLVTPQQPLSATVALPAGTLLNLGSVPTCAAPPACDPTTQVGTGTASVHYSTFTIPLNLLVFNTKGGVAIVIENPNGTPLVVNPTWSGTSLTIPYPTSTYKGVPILVSKIVLTFNKLGSGRLAYLRTPSTCPKGGWHSTATFTVSAGVTTPVTAAAKCQVAKKKKKAKKKH